MAWDSGALMTVLRLWLVFNHPEHRLVSPQQYIAAASAAESFKPLVLMPYPARPGIFPSISSRIRAKYSQPWDAVRKGAIQYLVNEGSARELACDCARVMKADGLVNVQTRNDVNGNPVLLETNMRPSGGGLYPSQRCEPSPGYLLPLSSV